MARRKNEDISCPMRFGSSDGVTLYKSEKDGRNGYNQRVQEGNSYKHIKKINCLGVKEKPPGRRELSTESGGQLGKCVQLRKKSMDHVREFSCLESAGPPHKEKEISIKKGQKCSGASYILQGNQKKHVEGRPFDWGGIQEEGTENPRGMPTRNAFTENAKKERYKLRKVFI